MAPPSPIAGTGALASGGRQRFGVASNALSWQAVAENRLRHPCSTADRQRYAANVGRKPRCRKPGRAPAPVTLDHPPP